MAAAVPLLRDLFRFLGSGTWCADWYASISVPGLVIIIGMSRRWVYCRLHGLASADQTGSSQKRV